MAMFDGGDQDFFGGMFDNGGGSGGGMSMPSTLGGGDAAQAATTPGADPYGRKSQWGLLGLYGDNGNLSGLGMNGVGNAGGDTGMYKSLPDNWQNLTADGSGQGGLDYSSVGYSPEFLAQLGYTGGDPRYNATETGSNMGDFSKYLSDNNYTLQRGYLGGETDGKIGLRAVDADGKQKAYDEWDDDPDSMFGIAMALAGGFAGAAVGGAAATSGYGSTVGSSASNAALADSAVGTAGYGASSASVPGWVGAAGSGAGGAFGSTMVSSGGDLGQSLKAGAVGGLTGGFTAGYNPASQVGIDDPTLQRAANGAITSGGRAALTGGNIGSSVLGSLQNSALGAGMSAGYNAFGGTQMPMDDDSGFSASGPGVSFQPWNGQGEMPAAPNGFTSYNDNSLSGFGGADMPQAPQASSARAQIAGAGNSTNPVMDFAKSMFAGSGGAGGKPGNFDGLAGNLMQLWQSRKNAGQYGNLANGLQDLYSPNSAYAQQLNQALTRSDAAAGRRSQVGPRNVELQARLAELNSRNAGQISQLRGAQQNNQAQQFQSLLRLGMNPMVQNGLGSMFSGFQSTPQWDLSNTYRGTGD